MEFESSCPNASEADSRKPKIKVRFNMFAVYPQNLATANFTVNAQLCGTVS